MIATASQLELCQIEIVYRCREAMELPRWKGSLLRGGFGRALNKTFCQRACADPETCQIDCSYRTVFNPPIRHSHPNFRTIKAAPRPYTLRPPLDEQTHYSAGELIKFQMLLFGTAIDQLLSIISAWTILGEMGLGQERGRVSLDQVYHVHPATGERTALQLLQLDQQPQLRHTMQDLLNHQPAATKNVKLSLVTPMYLKYQRAPMRIPEPHILIRHILRRLSMLSAWYGETPWQPDSAEVVDQAQQAYIAAIDTRWVQWSRRTGDQQHTMDLGGLVGNVTYANISPIVQSMLWLGSHIHIGKGCVFGNGWYRFQPLG